MVLLLALSCARPPETLAAQAARPAEVRYRPVDPPDADASWLVSALPGATWDAGLAAAAGDLLAASADRTAALRPAATLLASARAGFPGQARYARSLTGGARPEHAIDEIATSAPDTHALDVGLAVRRYGDGVASWILAWAPYRVQMDPIPRDLPLDAPLNLRVDLPEGGRGTPLLYLAPPDGPVERIALTSGVARYVDRFHAPGQYRLSVTLNRGDDLDVALLFSVFVDGPPPALERLGPPPAGAPDPVAAEGWLLSEVNEVRVSHGLRPVAHFSAFDELAREHAALMAGAGRVAHTLPGITEGVAARAAARFHPGAEHHEAVVAAADAEDALALLTGSPAHLAVLLCERCTQISVGAALEPVLDRPPRLFATLELLSFPNGPPAAVDHYNR